MAVQQAALGCAWRMASSTSTADAPPLEHVLGCRGPGIASPAEAAHLKTGGLVV